MAVLALGTVGGYASGFAHVACARRHMREAHHAAMVQQFARACADAARPSGPPGPPPGAYGGPSFFGQR
jgi:hypothetical protein